MAAVRSSCSCFVSPAAAVLATPARAKPPSCTLVPVPAGRRDERSFFPGLTLRRQRATTAALRRPGAVVVVVRAQSRRGVPPAAADRYFAEERKHVMGRYNKIVGTDHGCLYVEATTMSGQVCLSAKQALKLASNVMDSACLDLGAPNEISPDTIRGTLGAYVKIFAGAADAAYSKSVRKGTVVCFLGALKGLASISHILLDTALEALSHTHPRASMSEYAFNRDVEGVRDEFNRQMNGLEDGINSASSSAEICKLVVPGILEGVEVTGSFVGLMVDRRKRVLGKVHSEVGV